MVNSRRRRFKYSAGLNHTGDDNRIGHCQRRWHFRCHRVLVFVVGQTNKSALRAGFIDYGIKVNYVSNRDEAVKILDSLVNENDVVLFENDLPDHYP